MTCTSTTDDHDHDPNSDFVDLSIILEQRHTLVDEFFENKYAYTVGSTPDPFNNHDTSLALLLEAQESTDNPTLKEALKRSDAQSWLAAIETEYQTLYDNGTWEAVPATSVPQTKSILTGKIVLRVKRDPVRNTVKYKARVVMRGFNQIHGVDFHETYSPVASFKSIKTLLTIGAHLDYEIHQLAFLNASIKEEVYLKPIGSSDTRLAPNMVYRLRKTLYGLRQSPREWWLLLKDTLSRLQWIPTLTDQCVFFRDKPTGREYLAVYVDDLIVLCPNPEAVQTAKQELMACFKAKDLGELSFVLGIKVSRNRPDKTIILDQESALTNYLDRFQITGSATTPGFWSLPSPTALSEAPILSIPELQSRVGALLHIGLHTRPDILYAVNKLARTMTKPTSTDFAAAQRLLMYLKSTTHVARPCPRWLRHQFHQFLFRR